MCGARINIISVQTFTEELTEKRCLPTECQVEITAYLETDKRTQIPNSNVYAHTQTQFKGKFERRQSDETNTKPDGEQMKWNEMKKRKNKRNS